MLGTSKKEQHVSFCNSQAHEINGKFLDHRNGVNRVEGCVQEPLLTGSGRDKGGLVETRGRSVTIAHSDPLKQDPVKTRKISVGKKNFQVTNYGSAGLEVASPKKGSVDSVVLDISPPASTEEFMEPKNLLRSHSFPAQLSMRRDSDTLSLSSTKEGDEDAIYGSDYNANLLIPGKTSSYKGSQVTFVNVDDADEEQQPPKYDSYQSPEHLSWHRNKKAIINIARRGRLFSKRKQRRIMNKSGYCNLHLIQVEHKGLKYMSDIFTTFLEIRWRFTFILLFVSFALTWLLFGLIWWALVSIPRDGDSECAVGVHSFTTALLFSIETMHTIGYGTRAVTDVCPSAVVLVMIQSIVGVIISCICAGIVFAKLSRSKRRAATVIFSKNAVISNRKGSMCLMFRVGNLRSTQMMGVSVNAMMVKTKLNEQGKLISVEQESLRVTTGSDDSLFFLAWPCLVIHKIDESSPLWNYTAEELLVADFEIIVVLEAVCEATGGSTQVRTSYLPSEIQWGYKLAPLMTQHHEVKNGSGKYAIDFKEFHNTVPVLTPEHSAHDLSITPSHAVTSKSINGYYVKKSF